MFPKRPQWKEAEETNQYCLQKTSLKKRKKINILLNWQTTSSDLKVPRFILLYIAMLFYLSIQIQYRASGQG